MSRGSVRPAGAKVAKRTKELLLDWQQTKEYWRDVKSREFEKKFLGALPDAVQSASTIIAELDEILAKVRRDCE
ncbi:MAG: hypothetical protein AAGJ79_14685 [Verrucomicrobiota bacterium]